MKFLKIAFVGLLFFFLARKGLFSLSGTSRAFLRPELVGPGLAAILVTNVLSALRWHWLLGAQGLRLRWIRTLQLSFIGNFFNVALPGSVSGDVVKAYYASKESQGQPGRVLGTIVFDRIVGLAALVVVSTVSFIVSSAEFRGSPVFVGLGLTASAAAVATLFFFVYLFRVPEGRDPLVKTLAALEARFPRAAVLARTYAGLRDYRAHVPVVMRAASLSAANHMLSCGAGALFARALGAEGLPAGAVFAVVPLGFLASAVPLLPAGIGTGHAAFAVLFSAIGSAQGANVFNLFIVAQLLSAGIGGLAYLGAPRSASSRELSELTTSSRSS